MPDEEQGLSFRLSEGSAEAEPPVQIARPPATPLDETATRRVLDRLPPWTHEPAERAVALREGSLPPPRAGRTVETPFPPPEPLEAPEPETSAPLEILRHAPEGEVPLAPRLSVTFSQPMVAVTSHADLALATPPVRLTPEPPGEWRWVGTRTLVFQPDGRFPMATEYRAEVPAETKAVSGDRLKTALVWTFSTPPPTLVETYPGGVPTGREPILFAAFDQRIDAAAVLGRVKVTAGGALWALRQATDEEVARDTTVSRLDESAGQNRWLAFRTDHPLPPDAAVTVAIGAGTPSAEGPRRTEEAQTWTFRTHGPFRVTGHECGWGGRPCSPGDPWRIDLTNPVDSTAFRSDQVTVKPDVRGLEVVARGQRIFLRGRAPGRTTYRVTLAPGLRDAFGQTLGEAVSLEFEVGPAQATLFAPGGDFVVLDPAGAPRFPVYSVNHSRLRVQAWAVGPADWEAWREYQQRVARGRRARPPGETVLDTTVEVEEVPDALVETAIDLSPALPDGLGQLVLVVRPDPPPEVERQRQVVQAWVQATRLGLDAFADARSLLAWATALEDGRPLDDVEVSLVPGETARTDASGLVRLALGEAPAPLLVARRGTDVALLPAHTSWWGRGEGWKRGARRDTLRFCVFDDRHLYRPGEEVRVKGWLRVLGAGPRGDVGPVPSDVTSLSWTLFDSRGNEVEAGATALGQTGSFDLALTLPPTMNLGPARLILEATGTPVERGSQHVHAFEVQEFRRPEFEVTASATEGPHFVGGHVTATVSARYFAGGALPGADVSWRVAATPATFRPPGWDEFVFGTYVPWWRPWPEPPEPERVETFSARTDGAGEHHLRIDLDRAHPPRPRHLEAEATVHDVNRQAWTASVEVLVHPSALYVGLRAKRAFVEKGEAIPVDVVVTDLDGTAVAGRRVRLRAERLHHEQIEGEWRLVPRDVQQREIESTDEPMTARFDGREGGEWRLVAEVADDAGRPNETELRTWVAGGPVPSRRDVEQEEVTLVPDAREYHPGDVARVLVMAPFAPAEGLLTLRRSGLLHEERFRVEGGSHTLEIPIEEAWTPNVHVQVDLLGAAPRDEGSEPRPAFARGSLDLSIPPVSRRLELEVAPRATALAPGEETVLDVALRDAEGRPVRGGEVAVVVVDEAVLALTGYRLPDVLDVFYSDRGADVRDDHLRSHVLLGLPEETEVQEDRTLGVAGGAPEAMVMRDAAAPLAADAVLAEAAGPPAPPPIRARADFSALALFAPSLVTDAGGRVRVPLKVPDNLTRYRVMAVAAAGARRFGSGEATLVARLPLMVRPSPPRFLNFGDRLELPVVVQNQTDGELAVDVAVRARNAELTAGAGRRLVVAAHDRAEVRFPTAAVRAGTAVVQIGAVSGALADAAELALPVWTPATTEAFATYGQVDAGVVAQPVRTPEGVIPQFGGLELTTSSTALQALTDAVLYLVDYPFECAEQLSSRILAVAALRDVLAAFEAQGLPGPEAIQKTVARDVALLGVLQNPDGGFGLWRRGDPSWPWVSVHAAHALARAREKGFDVPDATLERSLDYLRNITRHFPEDYPESVRRTLVAYVLFVRARMDDPDPGAARALVHEGGVEGLSFEALGWVLSVLSGDSGSAAEVEAIRRRLANGVVETAASAHFAVSYGDGAYLLLYSDRRADAVILEALIADQPQSDLIPKLVAGLLAHRRAGRWENTQENVFVLLALDRYFQTYEATTPDFVARAWLGDRYAGEHTFRGHTAESHHVSIPMSTLRDAEDPARLLLAKDGPGRLYYRIGLRYAPESLRLEPLDRGFTVERTYQAVDDGDDVQRDAQGTWHLRAGARVRVTVTMVAPTRRYHVALVDPLPAGLEALNPALATTGTLPGGGGRVSPHPVAGLAPRMDHWWWPRPWFQHQNLRNERVEAFSSLVGAGVYTYSYVARATTPGRFVVPPPKAEEMYTPETFGRGASDVVVIE